MPTIHSIGITGSLVENATTTPKFIPGTPWMAAATVGKVRPTYEVVYVGTDLVVAFAYQVCNVENSIDSTAAVTTYNGAGVNYPSAYTDISSTTAGKQLVRFGWYVKLSAAGSQAFGYVVGSCDIMECD